MEIKDDKMINYSKTLMLAFASISLSGCLEVEDDNNENVVAALEAQNAILQQQQQQQQQQQTASVTLFGNIVDAGDNSQISNARVTVKVGATWREAEDVSGEFEITALPVNTDVVVLIQSTDGAFLERAFYGRTSAAAAGQVTSQSMGDLRVSKPLVKKYAILDAETNTAFEGLTFSYNPTSNFLINNSQNYFFANIDTYKVSSSFDGVTGLYSITLPEDLAVHVSASADIDGDDVNDFITESNNFWYNDAIQLNATQAHELDTLYVSKTSEYQSVELRVSVIDELGNSFENIEFFADDQFLGRIDAVFDTESKEYVFNYQTSSQVTLNMTSFISDDDINYQSASLRLSRNDTEYLSINDYGFSNNVASQVEIVEGIVAITVLPRIAYTPNNYVSTVSSIIDENDGYSLKEFYQAPIALLDDSVSLHKNNVLTVIKGNDVANDIVALGTTEINLVSEEVAINTALSHNNTFITAKASSQLTSGNYTYRVNSLVNAETEEQFEKNSTNNFIIAPNADGLVFDINDIKLDNNNGTTNGVIIVATNTANIANTASNNSRSSTLYLPESIKALDYLQLTLISHVRNGTTYVDNNRMAIIEENNSRYHSQYLVQLAANENIRTNKNFNYATQTSLTDGLWYQYYSNIIYSADNTQASENTATFNYVYRVAGQDSTVEGTITLPVL